MLERFVELEEWIRSVVGLLDRFEHLKALASGLRFHKICKNLQKVVEISRFQLNSVQWSPLPRFVVSLNGFYV